MKWLLDNLWIVIAIAAVIGKLLQAMRGKDTGTNDMPAPPKEFEFEDPELAERTRRIREEIRRKIEERRGQHTLPAEPLPERTMLAPAERPPEATPPPVVVELPEIIREVFQRQPVPEPPPMKAGFSVAAAEEAERQAALAEQLREAGEMKAAAERRAAFEAGIADQETVRLQQLRGVVLDDLRNPAALRRAFILREVLGPPVALR
jgi:type IV secretory pathway VirB10-like protein